MKKYRSFEIKYYKTANSNQTRQWHNQQTWSPKPAQLQQHIEHASLHCWCGCVSVWKTRPRVQIHSGKTLFCFPLQHQNSWVPIQFTAKKRKPTQKSALGFTADPHRTSSGSTITFCTLFCSLHIRVSGRFTMAWDKLLLQALSNDCLSALPCLLFSESLSVALFLWHT